MSDKNSSDFARQLINLIAAPLMVLLSNLPLLFDTGRTPSEFSDQNDSLLVPLGPAFSIWGLIFLTCTIYGIVQFLPKNREGEIFRQVGWLTAAGFIMVSVWSLVSAFAPIGYVLWGTALAFVPMVAFFVKAMIITNTRKDLLHGKDRYTVWLPIGLIAGWTSIAMFLNWTPIMTNIAGNLPELVVAMIMLVAALIFAIIMLRASRGHKAYAFPIIWGLTFLAIKRFTVEPVITSLAIATCIGVVVILAAAMLTGRRA